MDYKVLVVGEFSPDPDVYTYATSFVRAFKKLGYETESFNTKASYIPGVSKNYYLMNRFERFFSLNRMNHLLATLTKKNSFDLVFFMKPDVIKPATLHRIREHTGKMISFYPDNPFVVWNGNSNADVLAGLPVFDNYLMWSLGLIDPLYAAGAKQVTYFPFGFDAGYLGPRVETPSTHTFDTCFMGTWEPDRAQWLEELVKRMPEIRLGVWGNLWDEHLSVDSPVRAFLQGPAHYGKKMLEAFASSAIILNFIRQQNRGSHNMRTFEVPASGAFLLTERTYEQAEYLFTENESIACFSTPDELAEKIRYFLKNTEERKRIAHAGFERAQRYELTSLLKNVLRGEKYDDIKAKDRHFVASSL